MEGFGDNDRSLRDYKEEERFEFLPGHQSTLLSLRNKIECMQSQSVDQALNFVTDVDNDHVEEFIEKSKYTIILREFMKTADKNWNKPNTAQRYDDIVRYFAAYVFLLCGRTCYETLNENGIRFLWR